MPPELYAALLARQRSRGRPKAEQIKVFTAVRLDADVLATFKASSKGWQTRINAALRQLIVEQRVGWLRVVILLNKSNQMG